MDRNRQSHPAIESALPQSEPMFRPDAASAGNEDDDSFEGIGGGPIDAIVDAFSHYTDLPSSLAPTTSLEVC